MSVLGRIRVRETHGIRRFLYPLSVLVPDLNLGPTLSPGLASGDGRLVPLQITPEPGTGSGNSRLDFAASLAPMEALELTLLTEQPAAPLDDPLVITGEERFHNRQQRFELEFDRSGTVHQIVYDGVAHLRAANAVVRNGEQAVFAGDSAQAAGLPLSARVIASGEYTDGCKAETHLETTACKSWVMLNHLLAQPQPRDEVVFQLPLVASSSTLTCDFGVGGGIYGKLEAGGNAEIAWHNELRPAGGAHWSIGTSGRTDYVGAAETAEVFRQQCWFHLIDGNKALAVAITRIPESCRNMLVALRGNGDTAVTFKLGNAASAPATFGVCYHFLNNIPAIAAATNPQSILLPPTVEFLPA